MLTACGGRSGTLTLTIVTSPGDDPFGAAAAGALHRRHRRHQVPTVPVTMGHFTFKLSIKPDDMTGPIIVEALDTTGK